MSCGGFGGGPGWGGTGFGGPGFGGGPFGCELGGLGGFGFGPGAATGGAPGLGAAGFGAAGFGPGFGGGLQRAAIGTAALLLDGPADAAQIVQRTTEATNGAFTPPQNVAELVIGLLAGRGFVTVDNGVATLTDLGKNVLAWRGITSETAHAILGKVGQFADVIKIRSTLREIAGLARTIVWSGTDEQKQKLCEARANLLAAATEAKKSLHSALAED